ncbi:MAG: aminoacetone oxidase family FAD-binding enzyme [Clostridia bacterium]|nr:aminoacetone oxidase family FAD-binding enzyme [Clostridia bacterium]
MKTLVIGGGMAGLTYAIVALKNGMDVTIAERNNRVGKKIAATGNGKCNIGNANVNPSCFNDSKIAQAVLDEISVAEYTQFLNSCGIYTHTDEMGRMYPLCDSASNVVDCLRHQFAKHGGKLLTDTNVQDISIKNGKYVCGGIAYDKVVLACGSGSQCQTPSLPLVEKSWLTPTSPSLVPVRTTQMDGILNGIRAKCVVTLLADGSPLATESGEVLFKDYGLSGICIFNLSAIVARNNVKGAKHTYTFSIDLVPTMSQAELVEILRKRESAGEKDKLFYGILHNKLAESIAKRAKSAYEQAQIAKNFTFTLDKLLDYTMSQVTSGGIAEKFVDIQTLQLPNGAIALGEMLNVDGICGGNNLYFASASALYTFDKSSRQKAYNI